MNKIIKITLTLALAVLCVVSLCACSSAEVVPQVTDPSVENSAKFSIGVIQTDDSAEALEAYNGFIRAFTEKGYKENEYYNISVRDCDDSAEECENAALDFIDQGVDLIFTFDVKATLAAKKSTEEIPIIFCGVYDPIESGILDSCETPECNITGVSDFTPVKGQLEFIKRVLPDAKNISALYMSTDTNSVLISTLAQKEAEALEVDYNTFAVPDEKELQKSLKDVFKDADALYLCEDDLTLQNADTIVEAANKAKAPIFSATNSFMAFGTFATCLPDYEDLGFNAGELALICLKDLHPISNISVEYPVKYKEYVSESVAEELGITVEPYDNLTFVD